MLGQIPACSAACFVVATLILSHFGNSIPRVTGAVVDKMGLRLVCEMCRAGEEVSQCIWESFELGNF